MSGWTGSKICTSRTCFGVFVRMSRVAASRSVSREQGENGEFGDLGNEALATRSEGLHFKAGTFGGGPHETHEKPRSDRESSSLFARGWVIPPSRSSRG